MAGQRDESRQRLLQTTAGPAKEPPSSGGLRGIRYCAKQLLSAMALALSVQIYVATQISTVSSDEGPIKTVPVATIWASVLGILAALFMIYASVYCIHSDSMTPDAKCHLMVASSFGVIAFGALMAGFVFSAAAAQKLDAAEDGNFYDNCFYVNRRGHVDMPYGVKSITCSECNPKVSDLSTKTCCCCGFKFLSGEWTAYGGVDSCEDGPDHSIYHIYVLTCISAFLYSTAVLSMLIILLCAWAVLCRGCAECCGPYGPAPVSQPQGRPAAAQARPVAVQPRPAAAAAAAAKKPAVKPAPKAANQYGQCSTVNGQPSYVTPSMPV